MKNKPMNCDPSLLSQFHDQELSPDENARVSSHVRDCPQCRKELQDLQAVSSLFKAGLDKELSRASLSRVQRNVLERIQKKRDPWWKRLPSFFWSGKFLVPAVATAAVLVVSISVTRHTVVESGPSAIVSSFAGETSSVMIMETPDSQHTIIMFCEDL